MKQIKTNIKPFTRQFYRGNGIYFALAMVQTVVLAAAALLVSWLIQQIIDMISGVDIGFTFTEIALLVLAGILLYAFGYVFAYISKPKFIAKAMAQYKNYVYAELSKKNISAFSGENASVYISALSNDAASIEMNYVRNIFVIIDSAVLFVGALALMFYYNPLLTGLSIALSALPLIAAISTGNLVAKAEKRVSEKNESYMATLNDSLVGFSVIKSFKAELQMCRIFAKKVKEVSGAQCHRRKMAILVQMISVSAGNILQLGIFLIGAYLALSGSNISAGSVLIFVQLLNYIINPIETIPQALAEMKSSKALIIKLSDALSKNIREEGTVEKTELQKEIAIDSLSFSYNDEKTVLNKISYRFEKGRKYAIVGASGSGKSTLLNLMMASHSNYSGTIRYDDTELGKIGSEALYEMISVIWQNVFIFNASIRDNITMFGDYAAEDVERAINMSGLESVIKEKGSDYLCGENGSGLSGGEKQRISIARSLLKKSQVLLVDEATASLDAETACQVSSAILGLDGITSIVVTHSLEEALLKQYDGILTLKNGSIVESGTFSDLIAKKGYFYSLFTISQ